MSLSVFFKKIFAGQKARAGEAGQAVLEYILVLVVSVSIILGILYQFNDAFKQFLNSYFGDYIACLLETGELPSLGGEGPTNAECNNGFQNFSIASGRPQKESNYQGSSDTSQASNRDSSPDTSGGGSSSGRSASFNTGGNSPNAEAGLLGSNNDSRPPRQRLTTNDPGDIESTSTESGDDSGFVQRRRRIRRINTKNPVADRFLTRADRERKKEKEIISKKSKEQRRLAALKKAKFTFTPPEVKTKSPDVGLGGFTFGKFLKFLIIAGILIAIFIFLGGQALQIKKSWQKGD